MSRGSDADRAQPHRFAAPVLALLLTLLGGGHRMNISDALSVHAGAKVTSPFTIPARRPLRVTQVWVNERQTIVRFRIHALGSAWVDSSGVDLPPKGAEWNDFLGEWQGAAA